MKKQQLLLFFSVLLFAFQLASGQNVGIGTNTPKAALDVSSSNNGFLPPRMTFVQRADIQNPATGLLIYCTDCGEEGEMQYYNGTAWKSMNVGAASIPPIISSINCTNAVSNGTLTLGIEASGVNSIVPYTGGNGGNYTTKIVNSTGVTGLTATLSSGILANGAGNLTYTISGTPVSSGTATFLLSIAGQTCTLSRTVNLPIASVSSLNCDQALINGTLTELSPANGVNVVIPYTGGNGGTYSAQEVISDSPLGTSVSGLTATLSAGTLLNGEGNLTITLSGTPEGDGFAFFNMPIAGQLCQLSIPVGKTSNTITDLSGYIYRTVAIGTQVWMADDLKTFKYNDNSSIPSADEFEWQNNALNDTKLPMKANFSEGSAGSGFYNWFAINAATNGNKNVCPTGWHVPTDAEWTTLTDYLGGQNIAGGKMKRRGFLFWSPPNTDATNSSGFSASGESGYIDEGALPGVRGMTKLFWSISNDNDLTNYAFGRALSNNSGEVTRQSFLKYYGLSVRCVKD